MSSTLHSAVCLFTFFLSICTLPLSGATIEGVVINPDGSPAEGALVRLRPADSFMDTSSVHRQINPGKFRDITAGVYGMFILDSIIRGVYNIELIQGNYACAIDSILLWDDDTTIVLPPSTLKPPGTIRGNIKFDLPRDSSLHVFVSTLGFDRLVEVDTSGGFNMVLPEGIYTVRLFTNKSNYFIYDTSAIIIISGETNDIDSIYLPKNATFFQPWHKYLSPPIEKTFWIKSSCSYDLKGRILSSNKKISKGIYLRVKERKVYLVNNNRR